MFWAAVAAKGVSALGKFGAAKRQKKAAEESHKLALENAEWQRKENAESERRAERSIRHGEGEAKARSFAGGSGTGPNQNREAVMAGIVGENAKQLDWLKLSGETKVDTILREADYNKQIALSQAKATQWSAVSDIAGGVAYMDEAGVFESWGGKTDIPALPVTTQFSEKSSWMSGPFKPSQQNIGLIRQQSGFTIGSPNYFNRSSGPAIGSPGFRPAAFLNVNSAPGTMT